MVRYGCGIFLTKKLLSGMSWKVQVSFDSCAIKNVISSVRQPQCKICSCLLTACGRYIICMLHGTWLWIHQKTSCIVMGHVIIVLPCTKSWRMWLTCILRNSSRSQVFLHVCFIRKSFNHSCKLLYEWKICCYWNLWWPLYILWNWGMFLALDDDQYVLYTTWYWISVEKSTLPNWNSNRQSWISISYITNC